MITRRGVQRAAFVLLILCQLVRPGIADAKSHLWRFKEIFSNADGTIQYVEMDVLDPTGTGEFQTAGKLLSSRAHAFILPVDLPTQNTFLRSMLIATPAFAALPGAPTPDFIMPAQFFDPAGDELRYRSVVDVYAFGPGQLPVDGHRALQRSDGTNPINTPQNFAGATVTIDAAAGVSVDAVWPPLLVLVVAIAVLLRARNARPAYSG